MEFRKFCDALKHSFTEDNESEMIIYGDQFRTWFDISANGVPEITVRDDVATIDFEEGTFEFFSSATLSIEIHDYYMTFIVDSKGTRTEINTGLMEGR